MLFDDRVVEHFGELIIGRWLLSDGRFVMDDNQDHRSIGYLTDNSWSEAITLHGAISLNISGGDVDVRIFEEHRLGWNQADALRALIKDYAVDLRISWYDKNFEIVETVHYPLFDVPIGIMRLTDPISYRIYMAEQGEEY